MGAVLYYGSTVFALLVCIAFAMFLAPKYNIKRWKLFIIGPLFFIYYWGINYFCAWVEVGFQQFPSVNAVRVWIYIPIFILLCPLVFDIKFSDFADMVAPLCALGFGISHIGCVFEGCCHGYAYEGPFAIYNPVLNYNVFPTPILESLLAILAFVGLMIYMGKKKWKTNGQMYPIMLILFSGRFFLEFLRDNEKIWLGCSSLSFHALFAGVVGIVWLIVLNKINKRKETNNPLKSAEESFYKKVEISKEEYNKLKNKEITLLIILLIISLAITFGFIYWLVSRFVLHSVLFEKIMVSLLTLSALSLFGFLTYKIIEFFNNIEKVREHETDYLFFVTSRKVLIVENNKYYMFKTDKKLTLRTYNNELEDNKAK